MSKNSTIAVALVAVAGGFILGVVVTGRPEPKAAASLTGFLILVLLALGTVGAGVAAAPGWLKRQKRRAELEDAERLAQVYEALSGDHPQRSAAQPGQRSGPSIFVVGGGGQAEPGTVEDLARALGVGQ